MTAAETGMKLVRLLDDKYTTCTKPIKRSDTNGISMVTR